MKYSNFALWRFYWLNYKDRGIVLPIAIGLGLIAVLVGTIMLARSFRDQNGVIAGQLATKSESFAELGVTRYLDIINQNRAIASVNACDSWNLQTGTCQDSDTTNTTASWFTVTNKVTQSTSNSTKLYNLIDGVTNPATILSRNLTPLTNEDTPRCIPNTGKLETIKSFATQKWQSSDNNRGQFRLIDYRYDPEEGEGTLTVEGGVGQQIGNNNENVTVTETAGTGITRLEVRFPLELQPPWGLWIMEGVKAPKPTASEGVTVDANVRDSRCEQPATEIDKINEFRKNNQGNNRSYIMTQKNKNFKFNLNSLNFATLPPDPAKTPPWAERDSLILTGGEPTKTLPDSPPQDKDKYYYYYKFKGDISTPSIDLSGTGQLRVDAPGQTVAMYLSGRLNINTADPNKPAIEVTPGTTLIIYLDKIGGEVSISGKSLLKNADDNTPDNFQIYARGSDKSAFDPVQINVRDQANLDNIFIFAPYITFRQTISSIVKGTIWARSWDGKDNSKFIQGPPLVLGNLAIVKEIEQNSTLTLEDISVNKIKNISSWQRVCRPRPGSNDCKQ